MLNERFLFAPLNKAGFVIGLSAIVLLLVPYDLSRIVGLAIVVALVIWNSRLAKRLSGETA